MAPGLSESLLACFWCVLYTACIGMLLMATWGQSPCFTVTRSRDLPIAEYAPGAGSGTKNAKTDKTLAVAGIQESIGERAQAESSISSCVL